MILSIHQPSYFPWLGLLDKIRKCDVYMAMDEVQLSDSAYQHRNVFLTPDGRAKFLSIPFVRKDYLKKRFRDIEIASDQWKTKHLNFIKNSYGKYRFAAEIMPYLEGYYAKEYRMLVDAVMSSMHLTLELFGIKTKVVLQSETRYDRSLRRAELVVALARAVGARCYVSGLGGRSYLDEAAFGRGLVLRYNEFTHPVYSQCGSRAFLPGLTGLDSVFNLGVAGARALLANGCVGVDAT